MQLVTENYVDQTKRWPMEGRHILAQYDTESIVVYQAYRKSIGDFAIKHQFFGGEFSFSRMSWIKPNFLWMMYRCGWGTKQGQEMILAITIKRTFFDKILEQAVLSNYEESAFTSKEEWNAQLRDSNVRLQWDPDHTHVGNKLKRKAIQLGLRGDALKEYSKEAIVKIEDISDFVKKQRMYVEEKDQDLITPKETVYIPRSRAAIKNIKLSMHI